MALRILSLLKASALASLVIILVVSCSLLTNPKQIKQLLLSQTNVVHMEKKPAASTIPCDNTVMRSTMTLPMEKTFLLRSEETRNQTEKDWADVCPPYGGGGPIFVNQTAPDDDEILELLNWARCGSWEPENCKPRAHVALIIPFRDRDEHLKIFLRHISPIFKKQNLAYRIFVIEQNDQSQVFNRGKLMNVGFAEAYSRDQFDCYIFHDVDLLVQDDRLQYDCSQSPAHLSVAVDTLQYKLYDQDAFGGSNAISEEHFLLVNGFPNRYWGWGGEDDDLSIRLRNKNLTIKRPSRDIARFTMLTHNKQKKPESRFFQLKQAYRHLKKDGLNSLAYTLLQYEDRPLYTFISVDL